MLASFTGGATAIGIVAVAPSVAVLGGFAQAAAFCQAERLPDALLALYCVSIQGNEPVELYVALKWVAVFCCTASVCWAKLCGAPAVALQVPRAVDVFGIGG